MIEIYVLLMYLRGIWKQNGIQIFRKLIVAPFKRGIPDCRAWILSKGFMLLWLWHWYPWYSQISCLLL